MILSAQSIRHRCGVPDPRFTQEHWWQEEQAWMKEMGWNGVTKASPLIHPFHERTVHNGMTFGLSGAGYDVRIAEDIQFEPSYFTEQGRFSAFSLASTMERFEIPDDLMMMVMDKSSLARRGLSLFNTCAEPGWEGFLTLELTYHGREWLFLKTGDPIAQVVFYRLDEPTVQPYRGRYQDAPEGAQKAILAVSGEER